MKLVLKDSYSPPVLLAVYNFVLFLAYVEHQYHSFQHYYIPTFLHVVLF